MKKLPFLLLAIVFVAGCDKTNDDPNVSSDEARAMLQGIGQDMSTDIIDMMQSEGAASLSTLMDYTLSSTEFGDLGLRADEQKIRVIQFAELFGHRPASRVRGTEATEMPTGIFEWNVTEQDFVFVEASEVLVLKFPVAASETNNGIFTLSEFSFDVNGQPTAIDATISIDEEIVVSLELSANWSEDGLPEFINAVVFLKPFYFNINFDNTGAGTTFYASIIANEALIFALDIAATYSTPDKVFPKKINGFVQYRALKIEGAIDVQGALQSQSGDPNDFVDLKVFVDNEKIGVIIFEQEAWEDGGDSGIDYIPYIKYNDGTKEPLLDLFESVFGEIQSSLMAL